MVIHVTCLLAACASLLTSGCVTIVVPPSRPQQPATVYLVDSGRTASLVIPNDTGGLTRYAYGEWDWYALRKTAHWRAIPALLWPTRGALGRMALADVAGLEHLFSQSQNVYRFDVDKGKAVALSRQLDADFQGNIRTLVHTPSVGLDFVQYGHGYWAPHNSNNAIAGWLHDMDVDTRGYPAWSIWAVRPLGRD